MRASVGRQTACITASPNTSVHSGGLRRLTDRISTLSPSIQKLRAPSHGRGKGCYGLARTILNSPAIEGNPLELLRVSEAYWKALRLSKDQPENKAAVVVQISAESVPENPEFDVCVCGGTLGLFIALALQQQGFRVCIVEKRRVSGRTQEWNISRAELETLATLGLLDHEELEESIMTEFNPMRVGFRGGQDIWVRDCLNLGVSPKSLIAAMRRRFEAAGGCILENTAFKAATVHPGGVNLTLAPSSSSLAVGDTNRPTAVDGLAPSATAHHVPDAGRPVATNGTGKRHHAPGHGNHNGNGNGLHGPLNGACQHQQGHSNGNGSSGSNSSGGLLARGSTEEGPSSSSSSSSSKKTGSRPGAFAARRPRQLSCRLLVDCMGHYSDIVKQLRGRSRPDGMVLVVGGCAEGMPQEANVSGDLLYSFTDAQDDLQLFWEAFPAEGGQARTSYMFAYADAHPSRPTFEQLLDKYFQLLPSYQGVPLSQLRFKRVLFGAFPCYRHSPLKPGFDRILQVGDASASQSPLSFGGFGSMVRHLPRLSGALAQALREERLSRSDLSLIHPYQPSLSVSWLFQRAMSVGVGQVRAQHSTAGTAGPAATASSTAGEAAASVLPATKTTPSTGSSGSNGRARLDASAAPLEHPAHSPVLPATSAAPSTASSGSNGRARHDGSAAPSEHLAHSSVLPDGGAAGASHVAAGGSPDRAGGRAAAAAAAAGATSTSARGGGVATGVAAGASHVSADGSPDRTGGRAAAAASAGATSTYVRGGGAAADTEGDGGAVPPWASKGWMPANQVNRLLLCNFRVGQILGDRVLRPFLQDSMLAGPLGATMALMSVVDPIAILRVVRQLGPLTLLSWMKHFCALVLYRLLYLAVSPLRQLLRNYTFHRWVDALEYGSGSDYTYHPPSKAGDAASSKRAAAGQAAAAAAAAAPRRAPSPSRPAQPVWPWAEVAGSGGGGARGQGVEGQPAAAVWP